MRLRLAHLLPLAGLLCATSAEAATYYVRNGGNDSADGKSDATAWASLSKVNAYSFAAGDRVLFREGHRWVGQLTVDWPGTTSERAVVGAYYMDGSTPVRGYRTARPIIDGEDRLPSGRYDPLLYVRSDRVRVENLRVQNSEGRGIGVAANQAEVVGCSVSNVYTSGVHFLKSQGSLAESNFVTVAGIGIPRITSEAFSVCFFTLVLVGASVKVIGVAWPAGRFREVPEGLIPNGGFSGPVISTWTGKDSGLFAWTTVWPVPFSGAVTVTLLGKNTDRMLCFLG